MPDSMIAAISSVVPTGRRMKGSETFIASLHRRAKILTEFALAAPRLLLAAAIAPILRMIPPVRLSVRRGSARRRRGTRGLSARRRFRRRRRSRQAGGGRDRDACAVAQTIGAVDHDTLAGRQPRRDRGHR